VGNSFIVFLMEDFRRGLNKGVCMDLLKWPDEPEDDMSVKEPAYFYKSEPFLNGGHEYVYMVQYSYGDDGWDGFVFIDGKEEIIVNDTDAECARVRCEEHARNIFLNNKGEEMEKQEIGIILTVAVTNKETKEKRSVDIGTSLNVNSTFWKAFKKRVENGDALADAWDTLPGFDTFEETLILFSLNMVREFNVDRTDNMKVENDD
jgi:hypothetical protein